METVKVFSPIVDLNIHKTLGLSPIWDNAYHEDEEKPVGAPMVCYHVKFEGTKVIQASIPKQEDPCLLKY